MKSTALQFLLRSTLIPASLVLANSSLSSSSQCSALSSNINDPEPNRFHESLIQHRSQLARYRSHWDYNNPTSRIPTTSWPTNIPSKSILPSLQLELKFCSRSPNYRDTAKYCHDLQFRIAYALIQSDDASAGLPLIKDLAERGHPDSMCGYGMCLMQGMGGLEANPIQAVAWFRRCVEMFEHPQAMYELGVALFTGEGVVENEAQAVTYFRKAALKNHAGAAYMYGDCLLDGIGTTRDRAQALEWLVKAGDMGHRGARSRVLAVLEKKDGGDYGAFTDGSRQTFKNAGPADEEEDEDEIDEEERKERELEERLSWSIKGSTLKERKYTNMGSNPAVLAKRRTRVQESRYI